jgi:hypothetical protein
MPCSSITLTGITLDCGNAGGVSKVYLLPTDKLTSVAYDISGQVTGITTVGSAKFKEYSFRKGNADFSFKGAKDAKMGTTSIESTINLQFNKMENAKRTEIAQLLAGTVFGIVKDNNGSYWMVGYDATADSYLDLTSVDGATGAEMKDGNMYKLVLTASTSVQPYEVLAAAVTANI